MIMLRMTGNLESAPNAYRGCLCQMINRARERERGVDRGGGGGGGERERGMAKRERERK